MGLKPDELYRTTLYDYNRMANAFNQNIEHDFNVMRHNAYLVSVFSDMDSKGRKRLKPQKMFPLSSDKPESREVSREEVQNIFNRVRKRRGLA